MQKIVYTLLLFLVSVLGNAYSAGWSLDKKESSVNWRAAITRIQHPNSLEQVRFPRIKQSLPYNADEILLVGQGYSIAFPSLMRISRKGEMIKFVRWEKFDRGSDFSFFWTKNKRYLVGFNFADYSFYVVDPETLLVERSFGLSVGKQVVKSLRAVSEDRVLVNLGKTHLVVDLKSEQVLPLKAGKKNLELLGILGEESAALFYHHESDVHYIGVLNLSTSVPHVLNLHPIEEDQLEDHLSTLDENDNEDPFWKVSPKIRESRDEFNHGAVWENKELQLFLEKSPGRTIQNYVIQLSEADRSKPLFRLKMPKSSFERDGELFCLGVFEDGSFVIGFQPFYGGTRLYWVKSLRAED